MDWNIIAIMMKMIISLLFPFPADVFCVVSSAGSDAELRDEDYEDQLRTDKTLNRKPRQTHTSGHRLTNGAHTNHSNATSNGYSSQLPAANGRSRPQHSVDLNKFSNHEPGSTRQPSGVDRDQGHFKGTHSAHSHSHTSVNGSDQRMGPHQSTAYPDKPFYSGYHRDRRDHYQQAPDRWGHAYNQAAYGGRGRVGVNDYYNGSHVHSSYGGYHRDQYHYYRKVPVEEDAGKKAAVRQAEGDDQPSKGDAKVSGKVDQVEDEAGDERDSEDNRSTNDRAEKNESSPYRSRISNGYNHNHYNGNRRFQGFAGDRRDGRYPNSNFAGSSRFNHHHHHQQQHNHHHQNHHLYGSGGPFKSFGFREPLHPYRNGQARPYGHGHYGRSDRFHYNREDYRKESTGRSSTCPELSRSRGKVCRFAKCALLSRAPFIGKINVEIGMFVFGVCVCVSGLFTGVLIAGDILYDFRYFGDFVDECRSGSTDGATDRCLHKW